MIRFILPEGRRLARLACLVPVLAAVAVRPPAASAQRPVSPATVTCESAGGRRAECAIPAGASVQLLRTLSQAGCEPGRSWGVTGGRLWVDRGCRGEFAVSERGAADARRLSCASTPGARAECRVAAAGTVSLVRQVGQTPCVRGRTWGFENDRVWVSDGCAAEFEIGPDQDERAARPIRVVCESEDNRRNECLAGGAAVLVRQLSRTECVEGRTWGWARGRIWVDKGCRAEFEVSRP